MEHTDKQKERYGKLLVKCIKPLFEKYGVKMCRRNYLKIPEDINIRKCDMVGFEDYWSEDVIVLTSLGPITMFYKKGSGKNAKYSRFEHDYAITEKDAVVDKFLWKVDYVERGIQDRIEIIAKGIKRGLPDAMIESQVNMFEVLNTRKSFYTVKSGLLYKVIPCYNKSNKDEKNVS